MYYSTCVRFKFSCLDTTCPQSNSIKKNCTHKTNTFSKQFLFVSKKVIFFNIKYFIKLQCIIILICRLIDYAIMKTQPWLFKEDNTMREM